jgi:hypothetical protein
VSGTEGSIKPGVGSESLSWAVQQSHQGSPSSSETVALEMYGRLGVSRVGAVRRRLGCGGGAWCGGLRLLECGAGVSGDGMEVCPSGMSSLWEGMPRVLGSGGVRRSSCRVVRVR